MTLNNTPQNAVPGGWSLGEILRDLWVAWRLLWDPQVSTLLKLMLPVLALAYWISPVDLLPGLPFDDVAVLLVASRLFVSLVPADALARALYVDPAASPREWFRRSSAPPGDDDVVDTTWRVLDE